MNIPNWSIFDFSNLIRKVQVAKWRRRCRVRYWKYRARFGGELITRVEGGIKMHLDLGDKLSYAIYLDDFEPWERCFVRRFLKPGDIFLDIGANIGLFTLIAGQTVGPNGQVHAFEPCTTTYERLQANVQLNRLENVILNRLALSDTGEYRNLNAYENGYAAWNSLAPAIEGVSQNSEQVECMSLDNYIASKPQIGSIALAKIDVEGWESRVLQGGQETFSALHAPTLLIEFNDEHAHNAGSSCADIRNILTSYGYQLFRFQTQMNELVPERPQKWYTYTNLVATKNVDHVLRRLATGRT